MKIPYHKIKKFLDMHLEDYTKYRNLKLDKIKCMEKLKEIGHNIADVKEAVKHVSEFPESFHDGLYTDFRAKRIVYASDFKYYRKKLKFYNLALQVHSNICEACRIMRFTQENDIQKIGDNFYKINNGPHIWKIQSGIYMIIRKKSIDEFLKQISEDRPEEKCDSIDMETGTCHI